MINIIPANDAAARAIAADMRDADAVEVMASHGHTPLGALLEGLRQSDYAAAVTADGVPIAMFGLVVTCRLTGHGVPWLLSSNAALQHKREFLVQSKPAVQEMLNICPMLSNHVHADNRVSIRWLKWLGFTIDDPQPTGINGELFHRFHLEKVDV